MQTTEYEKQATDFLEKFGIQYSAKFQDWNPAPWSEDEKRNGIEQPRFQITLSRESRKPIVFDFWASHASSHRVPRFEWNREYRHGKPIANERYPINPTAYDVLACISGDWQASDQTFEEWASHFGADTDSRKAYATWERCRDFALKLRRFFTAEELEALSEIR